MLNEQKNNFKEESFKRKRVMQFAVTVPLFVVAMFSMNYVQGTSYAPLPFFLFAGAVGFSLYNWRCPNCKKYLGKNINPKFCPSCGKQLL